MFLRANNNIMFFVYAMQYLPPVIALVYTNQASAFSLFASVLAPCALTIRTLKLSAALELMNATCLLRAMA